MRKKCVFGSFRRHYLVRSRGTLAQTAAYVATPFRNQYFRRSSGKSLHNKAIHENGVIPEENIRLLEIRGISSDVIHLSESIILCVTTIFSGLPRTELGFMEGFLCVDAEYGFRCYCVFKGKE